MEIPLRARLKVASPIHIGCDDVYEPTSFVIDEKRGVILEFDPIHFIRALTPAQRLELLKICSDDNLLAIFKFVRRAFVPSTPCRETAIASGLADHYKKVLAMSSYIKNTVINQFTMNKTAYNPQANQPYIPGTSVKGALRTAYLTYLASLKGTKEGKGASKRLEETLLDGAFAKDPFRMVKVSDFQALEHVKTRIIYGVNRKKTKSERASRAESGPPQIFEVLQAGSVFEGTINIEDCQGAIENPVQRATLFAAVNRHYKKILKQDIQDLQNAGLEPFHADTSPDGGLITRLLIRIGRHSGAEAVTIEGHRNIKIMQGKGQPNNYLNHATTFWLASETSKPVSGDGLVPFGWAVLEIAPLDPTKVIYANRPTTEPSAPTNQAPGGSAMQASVETTRIEPKAPVQHIVKNITLLWNPGNRSLTATVEGKKALIENIERSFVPESLWPKLEKKKSVKTTIVVETLGNAFRIVKVEDGP